MDEVTGITVSLVKEFLSSSKAFSTTLNAFNSESTKYQPLISKRSDLAKALKITKLVKENSSRDNPRSSFLEVIVHYLMSKSSSSTTPKSSAPTPKSVTPTRNQPTKQPEVNQVQPMIPPDQTTSQSRNILSNSHLLTSVLPPRASSKGVPDSDGSTDNPHRSQMTTRPMDKSGSEGGWASAANDSRSSGKGRTPKIEDIEVLDHFSDEEEEETLSRGINLIRSMRDETNSSIPPALTTRGKPIELDVQYALRSLVLPETPGSKGSNRSMGFPDEWKGKGFVFRQSADDLAYGLVQSKGGPCGLLAVVQAYVIKHLILGAGGSASAVVGGYLRPSSNQCKAALVDSLAEILWQCGQKQKRAIMAICTNGQGSSRATDDVIENLELHEFVESSKLRRFLDDHITMFTAEEKFRNGLIEILCSAVLSRGIDVIRDEDMDEPTSTILGRHGYCTQELINLLVIGKAISNCFDGDIDLGDGKCSKLLKGIHHTPQFGHLSLFEHYGSLQVGKCYKNPKYPIFIVCSESHYTVLFSVFADKLMRLDELLSKSGQTFDLFYYDGLANQDGEIRLTISGGIRGEKSGDEKPPLELCIQTKWPGASVNWNGTEPIL